MEKIETDNLFLTSILRTIATWLLVVSAASSVLNVEFKMLAIAGVGIGAILLATTMHQVRAKELIKEMISRIRLLSSVIGVGIGIALFLSLAIFSFPFGLPCASVSSFVAGFAYYKMKGNARETWIQDLLVTGFATYLMVSILLRVDSTIRMLGIGVSSSMLIMVFLIITARQTLAAFLGGTISSVAGYLVSSVDRKMISFGAVALFASTLISYTIIHLVAEPVFRIPDSSGVPISVESMILLVPSTLVYGAIITCFLSIFQRNDLLRKMDFRATIGSISLGLKRLIILLPLGIKILVGCGILVWLAINFLTVASPMFTFYPERAIFLIIVLAGTGFISLTFLNEPSTERGFLLFGFIMATTCAVPFSLEFSPSSLLYNVSWSLIYLLFSFFMVLWYCYREKIGMIMYKQPFTTSGDEPKIHAQQLPTGIGRV